MCESDTEKRENLLINACKEITDRIPYPDKLETVMAQKDLFVYLFLCKPIFLRSISMLLETIVPFFKLNETVLHNLIHACSYVSVLSEDSFTNITIEDLTGYRPTHKPLVNEICESIRQVKIDGLGYLTLCLKSFIDNKKSLQKHNSALMKLIDSLLKHTVDKEVIRLLVVVADLFKSTIEDQFLVEELEDYLNDNLFDKYKDEVYVSDVKIIEPSSPSKSPNKK